MVRAFPRQLVQLARISLITLLLLRPAATAWAGQAVGSIVGTVVDPAGARVVGATVKLLRDSQVDKDVRTDGRGDFVFRDLQEGRYQIQASADGFQVRTTSQMFLAPGANLALEVSLPLGPVETAVTVTAAANEILPSQVGASVTVLDKTTIEALGKPDVLEVLRLVSGSAVVQIGARGGATGLFVRGGNSNFTKVLVDGISANDIGGGIDLSELTTTGVERIEVLREANSVVTGTDGLAGVVSVISRRGTTPVPEASVSLDGGTLSTSRESASFGGVVGRGDYFSELSHLGTDNDLANNAYRNTTYAGRFGLALGPKTEVSATMRWVDRHYESPNAASLYGVPDDFFQNDRVSLVGAGMRTQITDRWLGAVRVGLSDQRLHYENPTLSGEDIFGVGFGSLVTIAGANGYSASGRAALDYGPYSGDNRSTRRGIYAQTTYQLTRGLSLSGGGNYEREQAFTSPDTDPTTTRHNRGAWAEGRATLADRISTTAGIAYAHIDGYASRYSPRLSVAAYVRKPTADGVWSDTRVTFNAGKGIKATDAASVGASLYQLLQKTAAGAALAGVAGIGPIGPERGRNADIGIEQGLSRGRARVRATYFNNEFFDLVEFVSKNSLPQLGIPRDVAAALGFGAYVNSQSFAAQGMELGADLVVGRFRLAGGYTYLDATVTKSLSSAVAPQFNPRFPGLPIGGFAALVGERPFRRAKNIGSLLILYMEGRATIALSGYFAGKSDDTTFLVGSDIEFGNTLLLPNQDLDFGYQKIDLSASYRIHPRIKWYATIENLLNQRYEPAFGFPGLPVSLRTGVTVTLGGR